MDDRVVVRVRSGRAFTASSQWGYEAVVVDGTVRVWDDVAGHFTACHGLSPRQEGRVRRLAAAAGRQQAAAE